MAFTFTSLKTAIQDYVVSTEATLVTHLPTIITQAEDRILKDAQLPNFRINKTKSTIASDQYISTPVDFLSAYSMAVDNSGFEFLLFKEVNFLRAAYPNTTTEGVPRYYCIWDDAFFMLAPTPDAAYSIELHYFYRPESITVSAGGDSWLGTNAEACLLAACLFETAIFQKSDPDMLVLYENKYKEEAAKLKLLGEGYNKTDSYRSG